jgi:hypothetical protein
LRCGSGVSPKSFWSFSVRPAWLWAQPLWRQKGFTLLELIIDGAGSHFDPKVVEVFLAVMAEG